MRKRKSLLTSIRTVWFNQPVFNDLGLTQIIRLQKNKTLFLDLKSILLRRQIIIVQKIRTENLIQLIGFRQSIIIKKLKLRTIKSTLNLSTITSQKIKGKKKTKDKKGKDVELDI